MTNIKTEAKTDWRRKKQEHENGEGKKVNNVEGKENKRIRNTAEEDERERIM